MSRMYGFAAMMGFALASLAGCGLGSVATSTATEAAAQAQAAKDAKALEDKMRHDIEAAQQAGKQRVDDAEAAATDAASGATDGGAPAGTPPPDAQ